MAFNDDLAVKLQKRARFLIAEYGLKGGIVNHSFDMLCGYALTHNNDDNVRKCVLKHYRRIINVAFVDCLREYNQTYKQKWRINCVRYNNTDVVYSLRRGREFFLNSVVFRKHHKSNTMASLRKLLSPFEKWVHKSKKDKE